jgi:hypothetical protein
MFDRHDNLAEAVASGIDLVVDFATLGEYGYEPYAAAAPCRRRPGSRTRSERRPGAGLAAGWEALFPTKARRGACRTPYGVVVPS